MKLCKICGVTKDEEKFAYRTDRNCRQHRCRECQKAYRRVHYLTNKQKYKDKALLWRLDSKKKIRKQLLRYFQEHPCVDCGETDPLVLEFDHKSTAVKTDNVSTMITDSRPMHLIMEEIEKCEVRCANCHRRSTAIQGGWDKIWQ